MTQRPAHESPNIPLGVFLTLDMAKGRGLQIIQEYGDRALFAYQVGESRYHYFVTSKNRVFVLTTSRVIADFAMRRRKKRT